MLVAGLDAGSRTCKLIVVDVEREDRVVARGRLATTYDPVSQVQRLLNGTPWDSIVSTGYGRKLLQQNFGGSVITEIQAHAIGARWIFPEAGSVLDIGGQDTKVISLDTHGKVKKFEMNDRCAAGTGKFLEFMAKGFDLSVEEFGCYAMEGAPGVTINSMCTVFAETEATSLIAQGHRPQDIALALHVSVVKRSLSMLKRIATRGPLVFSGGVARNPCMVELLRREAGFRTFVPPDPDLVGALGAALYGAEMWRREQQPSLKLAADGGNS